MRHTEMVTSKTDAGRPRATTHLKPTSADQAEAWSSGRLAAPDQVRPGVWSIAMGMPGLVNSLMTVIRDSEGAVHVIDPALDTEENWAATLTTFEALGLDLADVATVVCTHLHADHFGLTQRFRVVSEPEVIAHRIEQDWFSAGVGNPQQDRAADLKRWGAPASVRTAYSEWQDAEPPRDAQFTADRLVVEGETIRLGEHALEVIHTPGHTAGHMCLHDAEHGLLFTGDHVLPTINPGLGLGGRIDPNPLAAYLDSLERIAAYDHAEVLPGHGFRFRGLRQRAERLGAHQRSRGQEVAHLVEQHPGASVWDTASRVSWTGGWEALGPVERISALAQTEMFIAAAQA
ncbi:MBL fold metallo-hydrolase [Ruicaihuangia caeni]|uniref:MBL fold metallo-hydrolase n=1 Tax=Ruicaihuangia caeni TaxID=3042517 RepID=UPI00338D582D